MLVSEVNTIPGFTPISMYPKLWQAFGPPLPTAHREVGRPGHRALRTPPPTPPHRPLKLLARYRPIETTEEPGLPSGHSGKTAWGLVKHCGDL